MPTLTKSTLEAAVLDYFADLGYQIQYGPHLAPDGPTPQRASFGQVVLAGRLQAAIQRLNPTLPPAAHAEALRQALALPHLHPGLLANNRAFHRALVAGLTVEYPGPQGPQSAPVTLVDFTHPDQNDFLAVNQFTVVENKKNRRPDVLVFLNGLPVGLIELKNPADEKATVEKAFAQLQTYRKDIPTLFVYNEICVISDGHRARLGVATAPRERFTRWREMQPVPEEPIQIQALIEGVFAPHRLLDLLRWFIVFSDEDEGVFKKIAAYHQYFAVNAALQETVNAASPHGDRRAGVVWHTQGSGKSLTMLFFAGKLIQSRALANPTLLVLTDRNDLDDQLFGAFAAGQELLRQAPVQAADREHLRGLLRVASGGVVFTTVQKFMPEPGEAYPCLSERTNIIVIADEAHRSQYDFIDGYARHMRDALPNASFIGFTGTPIELSDRSTRQVFGEVISVYDIERAIQDKVTVPIYYEARLAKIALDESQRPQLDRDFEEVTEGEENRVTEQLKNRWARLEALVGAEQRLQQVAADIVQHFEARQEIWRGKAMVVAMSRRIAVDLYAAIVKLRPHWHSPDDSQGVIKVVMTGSASDPAPWQQHIRTKSGRKAIEKRFKDVDDQLQLVIVRDMWLTGFDVPPLHTLYIDKPMQGHGLMQAIARVNRVFGDKQGGLVVDYLGIAEALKQALVNYTASGGHGQVVLDQQEAVAVMQEKYEIVSELFRGLDPSPYLRGKPAEQLAFLNPAMDFVLSKERGKERCLQHVTELSKAFALAVPHPAALAIRDEVGFFQAVRAGLVKTTPHPDGQTAADLDQAVRQIIARAVAPQGVVDIFAAAGLPKPDISILSDSFLQGLQDLPQRNLAVELLQKLLNDEIHTRSRRNLIQSRQFSEMLQGTLNRYQNRTIQAAQVIQELIILAKDMRHASQRGERLGLNEDELAFYDALALNDSAVQVMGDQQLSVIARAVLKTVHNNVTIDWTVRESVRANLRRMVKRVLRRYGYPPDMQEKAAETVLEQAELLARDWAA